MPKLAKMFQVKRIQGDFAHQPLPVGDYVNAHLLSGSTKLSTMFIRLIALLASRGFLHAAEVVWIATGVWNRDTQYSTWTPQQEIDEGKEIPTGIVRKY